MSTKQEILNWMSWNEPGEDFNSDAYFFYILDVEYENNSMEEENYEAYILLLKQLNYRLENDIFDDFLHTYYFYKAQRQRNELIKQANELNECFIEMLGCLNRFQEHAIQYLEELQAAKDDLKQVNLNI